MSEVNGTKGRGGMRPGAGRKPKPDKKVQVTITLTQEQRADMAYIKSKAVDTNALIGRELHRLAVALELAESGIV